MTNTTVHYNAPKIANTIGERLNQIKDHTDIVFGVQLSYHDHTTLFYLEKVVMINFDESYIGIIQTNNSTCYLSYNEIYEYFIINKDDVFDGDYI